MNTNNGQRVRGAEKSDSGRGSEGIMPSAGGILEVFSVTVQ